MIRVNLLDEGRLPARGTAAAGNGSRWVTSVACLVLAGTAALVGSWHVALHHERTGLDARLAAAQREAQRVRPLVAEVRQLGQQREGLEARLAIIERLRSRQSMPVRLLDHVSRSIPDGLWLTGLRQAGGQVTIEGRCATLVALSDFVGNLASGTLFEEPVEIVTSRAQLLSSTIAHDATEVIEFTVRARIHGADAGVRAPARGGGGNAGRRGNGA